MTKDITINSFDRTPVSITTNNYDYSTRVNNLTPDEIDKCHQLTQNLNHHDITTLQTYGSELDATISKNGEILLAAVRADNNSPVVELTNELLGQLSLIDIKDLEEDNAWKKFIRSIPFVGDKIYMTAQGAMIKYDNISSNVDKIVKKMDSAKTLAMRDNSTLQTIFDNNINYIGMIREQILALKLKDKELTEQINEMMANPENYEVYEISDMQAFQNSLQKRAADMETTEYMLTQNLMQIRATQGNNVAIADKAANIVNHTMPLWRNQLAIAIIMQNQKASIDAQQKITEATNRILVENAKCLKMNSINVAKANEEPVISLETLRKTTDDLIETVKEVKRIHEEGTRQRFELESQLQQNTLKLENEISQMNNMIENRKR